MTALQVDSLLFTFARTIAAERYDKWQHYTQVCSNHLKAVDVVAVERQGLSTTWLIEAKDFRRPWPPKPSRIATLAETVAAKVKDTLNGLEDAALHAVIVSEKNHAISALAAPTKRVVLHLEPHIGPHTRLFPIGFRASVLQKLRQLVRATDPNPLVLDIADTAKAGVPWTVT